MTEEQLEFLRNNTSVPEEDYRYCIFNEHGVFTPKYNSDGVRIGTGEDSYNEYLNPPQKQPDELEILTSRVDGLENINAGLLLENAEHQINIQEQEKMNKEQEVTNANLLLEIAILKGAML